MDFAVSRWEARKVCAALLLTIFEQLLELASAPRASTRLTPGAPRPSLQPNSEVAASAMPGTL